MNTRPTRIPNSAARIAVAAVIGALTAAALLSAGRPASAQTPPPAPRHMQMQMQMQAPMHTPPGMARMHELMVQGNPGMARHHELMSRQNPGMARMHELMTEGPR